MLRRLRRRTTAAILLFTLALAAVIYVNGGPLNPSQPVPNTLPEDARGPYPVQKVTDGDTLAIDLDGQETKLRLIGLDTPETVDPSKPVQCFGPEASAAAKDLLEGARVYIETDPSQGETDRYGRTLAYLWLADGTLFNQHMISDGYAHEYTYDGAYKYQAAFRAAEEAAQDNQAGLWSPATCNGTTE